MKPSRILLFLPLILLIACGRTEEWQSPPASITLVESIPEETFLDVPEIPQTVDIWLDAINSAEQTLDIAQFYIAHREGEALEPVLDAVIAAGHRGVEVRILVEKKFEEVYADALLRLRTTPGSEIRLYDISAPTGGGVHHAKYFIVDGRTVFVGSQNWDWRALTQINELGVRVTNLPVASAFAHLFAFDWALAGGASIVQAGRSAGTCTTPFPVVITDSLGRHEITPVFSPDDLLPQGLLWDETAILDLIRGAKDSLKLQLLTYRSHPPLEEALRAAAGRGVRVQILVSDWSLHPGQQEDLKQLQSEPNVTVQFSSIPEHSRGFISFARVEHGKYLIADRDRAWIGTGNWSRDTFLSSRNAGIILTSRALVARLHSKFNRSWDGPYVTEIDPEVTYTPRKRDDGSDS
ncbi:MAG: phospholipase [Bacteroidetes bacterium]|nr:phospholipase [Bacteroidota bacterium]